MVIAGDFVATTNGKPASQYIYKQFYPTLMNEGTDYMAVSDYIWRWDADWFWVSQIFPFMSFTLMRYLIGAQYLRSDMYKVFNDAVMAVVAPLTKNQELVIQDIEVPVAKSAEWIHIHLECTQPERLGKIKLRRGKGEWGVPIWVCPVVGTGAPLMPMTKGDLYMNFGFWDACEGLPDTLGGNETAHINRKLEAMCKLHGAKKTLYSSVHFNETEFRAEYNGDFYQHIKQKYDANGRLRPLYDRLTRS